MIDTTGDPTGLRAWYRNRSAPAVVGATALSALGGGGLLDLSTRRSSAPLGLIGLIVATLSALVVVDYIAERRRRSGPGGWTAFVLVGGAIGLAIILGAEVLRWPFPAFVGLMTLTLVLGPIVVELTASGARHREVWMQVGLITSFLGAAAIAAPGVGGSGRVAAIVLTLSGLGAFTTGLTAHTETTRVPSAPLLRFFPGDAARRAVTGAVIGGVVMAVGIVLGNAAVGSAGAWLVLVSMIVLSVRPRRLGLSITMHRTIFWGGVALVLVGGYQLFTTDTVGRSVPFLMFLVATISLAGTWIVWRGATIVVAVLVGFVFVWGLFSHTVDDALGVSGGDVTSTSGVVAFGDSFISGEGAPDFFDSTDQKGSDRNECRRAPTAYPALVALDGDGAPVGGGVGDDALDAIEGLSMAGLDFFACSGAKLADVLDVTPADGRRTNEGRDLPCEPGDDLAVGQYPCGPSDVYGSRLQIDHLPGADADRDAGDLGDTDALSATELVLLSIGGNDVRFGDIVAGCLLPGSCAERREVWLDNVTALGPELTAGYERLRSVFDPDGVDGAAIVVMPYPLVLTEDTCAGSPLDRTEHEFIYEFTTVLNQQIAASARQAGVHFFDDGTFAFDGHRLCEDGERAINLIGLQPTDGPLSARLNPGSWTHNSMHPNEIGHRLTAEALTGWLNENEILEGPNPAPAPTTASALLGVRTARPYAVAPGALETLRDRRIADCDFDQLSSFATRISIFDDVSADDESTPFRVPVAGADPSATICVTDGRGQWRALEPMDDDTGDAMVMASDAPIASVQDGRVFVTGGRPRTECPPVEQDDGVCAFQWILFASPVEIEGDDTTDEDAVADAAADRTWSLRAVRYCSTDPDCDSTFGEWSDTQISRAARKVVPTVALILIGGWLTALGLMVLEFRPFSRGRPPTESV